MSTDKSLTYTTYLALEEILGAQRPKSDEHDEILFIVVHQVYELWFKQLIHELRYLQRMLEEGNDARAFATFKRVLTILKLVVAQLDVIETMTPVQFLEFRDRLEAASGFQSGQFRELEAILASAPERAPRDDAAARPRPRPAKGEMIGRVEIPRLGVSVVVRAGSDARTLQLAVGHIAGTPLPGESGNVGLAGTS